MWLVASVAAAQDCARRPVEAEIASEGATALAVSGWMGTVTLVPTDGSAVTFSGTACDDVVLKPKVRGGRVDAIARFDPRAQLVLTIGVPRTIENITVSEHRGPVAFDGVQAHIAVVSSDGAVRVQDGRDVRLSYSEGSLAVDGLAGDLVVDRLVGTVEAKNVGGGATIERVTGNVVVDGVAGDLSVRGGDGDVTHANVRGAVDLG
jgi:hypothetical protein